MTTLSLPENDVIVVIPCLNEAAHLDGLLEALMRDSGGDGHTIVVADGGSTDGSVEIAQAWADRLPNLHLLPNPARLQSAAVNAAVARYGTGKAFLVRVDAHATYPDDYVERLTAIARSTGADSVVVPMTTSGTTCFQSAVAVAQNSLLGTGGAAHRMAGPAGWVDHGHHALMRLDRFRAVGGYDPRFSHNEDAELDTRLRRAGARIWLAVDLGLGYVPRAAPQALFRQYLNYGRGRARTVRLHGERLKPRQVAPLLVAPAVALAPFALLAPLWPVFSLFLLPFLVWALACVLTGLGLSRRGPLPCAVLAGPAAMIMHLAWSSGFWTEAVKPPLPPRPSASL